MDKRADIWAFGVVLYEMLTGRRAFEGEDVSETIAAVLIEREPDWAALPATLPPRAPHAVSRRCLQKDPRQRLRDIGDVAGWRWRARSRRLFRRWTHWQLLPARGTRDAWVRCDRRRARRCRARHSRSAVSA